MSDIFSGRELSVQYNADIGNRTPQGAGNVVINQINTFPTLRINSEANNFETYDSDYRTVLLSDKSVTPFDIVVNYLPDEPTHQFLDNAAKSQQLFQIIIQYQMNKDESTITYAMVNGYITSNKLDGDIDSAVTKAYSFTPQDVIARAMTINALSPIYQGDYGLGSNTTDIPQYSPAVPTGNSFIKVPSSQAGNPAGADLMGVGLVDGTAVSSLAMTKTGTLSIYAKNATTAWTRIYTATQMDGRYVPLTRTINGHALTANVVLNSEDTGSVPDTRTVNGKPLSEDVVLTSTDTCSVPDTRTVNGHVLSEDLVLSSEDTGSVPDTRTVNGHVLSENVVLSSEDTGSVPDTRMVNGHVLSEDVVLTSTDVGLGKVTDDAQLTIAGNLSDLGDVEEARINLAVYSMDEVDAEITALADSITSLDSASMKKASNLSDLSSLSTARTNLQVNRLTQGATYTDLSAQVLGINPDEMLKNATAYGAKQRTDLLNSMVGYQDPNQGLKDTNSLIGSGLLNDNQKGYLAQQQNQRINGGNPLAYNDSDQKLKDNADAMNAELQQNELLLKGHEDYEKRKAEITAKYNAQAIQISNQNAQDQLSLFSTTAQSLSQGMVDAFGESSGAAQAAFALSKGITIAQTVLSIQSALAQALATPWPASLANYAQVLSLGMSIISTAKGAAAGQFHGGIDEIPAHLDNKSFILKQGERVVQGEANKKLTAFLDKQEGGSTSGDITVNAPLIIQGDVAGDDKKFNEMLKKHANSVSQAVRSSQKRNT